jgi:hypothetical protein
MSYDAERWLVWAGEGTRAWVGARAAAQERALEESGRSAERSERATRVIVVVIGILLAVNLVLLVVLAEIVDLI